MATLVLCRMDQWAPARQLLPVLRAAGVEITDGVFVFAEPGLAVNWPSDHTRDHATLRTLDFAASVLGLVARRHAGSALVYKFDDGRSSDEIARTPGATVIVLDDTTLPSDEAPSDLASLRRALSADTTLEHQLTILSWFGRLDELRALDASLIEALFRARLREELARLVGAVGWGLVQRGELEPFSRSELEALVENGGVLDRERLCGAVNRFIDRQGSSASEARESVAQPGATANARR